MKRYMAHILISAEKITEHFLKVQVHDEGTLADGGMEAVSYTHLRAHETVE